MTYEKFKKNFEEKNPRGLGDTIKKVTSALGIDKAVKYIFDKAGRDCGCDARQEVLNTKFKYDVPKCLEEDEYNYLKDNLVKFKQRNVVSGDEQKQLLKIYNRVFKRQKTMSQCATCVQSLVTELLILLKTYE